jgi:tRNA (mo5U34)-methyltransferase
MDLIKTNPSPDRRALIDALGPWFHNLHLPDGTQTAPAHPLGDFPMFKWRTIAPALPADLHGLSVLDVGCNAGFYSFELAKRGAHVIGIDREPLYLRQARWAAREFGLESQVELRQQTVYDLGRSNEVFDIVLFMGVMYHLRHPLLALDILARKVRALMVFQTLTMPGEDVVESPEDMPLLEREAMLEPGWPLLAFIEKRLANDLTNWWAPNHAAVLAMLRSSGMRVIARAGHETYLCEPASVFVPDQASIVAEELASIFPRDRPSSATHETTRTSS